MVRSDAATGFTVPERVDWVDYAKGLCIILVVMMHSTLGVEAAAGETGWMHHLVAFAQPFRMPDFFLISALFLYRRIDAPWPLYLDRKVVHFAYFYLLWLTIQFALKAPGFIAEHGADGTLWLYASALWQPFGTLWFIHLLAIFFLVTRLLRGVPPLLIFAVAAGLEIAPIETGSVVIDEFAARFVYFYTGYWLAGRIFAFAERVAARPAQALSGLSAWALVNWAAVAGGVHHAPVVSLVLGLAGCAAIVTIATLLARADVLSFIRYCGARSIIVYLAFFLPMAASRAVLVKLGVIDDVGTISLLVTIAGVTGPLVLAWLTDKTGYGRFLFERPAFARLVPAGGRARLQPAE